MSWLQILAQENVDGLIPNQPDSPAGWLVFGTVAVVLGLVYWVIRRSRNKSSQDYWDRRRREEQQRLDDPDMAKPLPDPAYPRAADPQRPPFPAWRRVLPPDEGAKEPDGGAGETEAPP